MALLVVVCIMLMGGCQNRGVVTTGSSDAEVYSSSSETEQESVLAGGFAAGMVPPYSGSPSLEINGNVPFFSDEELEQDSFEAYSNLDGLGRCGAATALIGKETMPISSRGSIGMVKPSGWQIAEYDWIDGKYLFNRCHLIAYSLAGENDNPLNLITGTRSMNTQGMLPYEESVAAYVNDTGNHVLYRVTPVFLGDDLVAAGVLMEAQSVEDAGSGVRFCVWCYNVEPGVVIDYATGDSRAGDPAKEVYDKAIAAEAKSGSDGIGLPSRSGMGESPNSEEATNGESSRQSSSQPENAETYVLNTNTHRFHYPNCSSVSDMKEKNKQIIEGTREEIINMGYSPCGVCKPWMPF